MHFPHLRFPARARLPRAGLGALFVFAIVTGGCAADSTAPDPERVGRDSAPQITNYGYIPENGMGLTFAEVVNPTGLDLQNTVGIAACGPTTLYATTFIGFGYALYFSNDSGQSWKSINAYAFGPEIACDHSNLATLNPGDGSVWTAPLLSSGLLTADSNNVIWRQQPNTAAHPVDRIQGGDGSFYGVKKGPNGNQLYVSSLQSINARRRSRICSAA